MLPLSALMVTLAGPIVRVVYERYAVNQSASQFVTPLLMAYSIGMFVYLGRDVLVRVFYALGDGETPFRISIINIFLYGLFDYLLVGAFGAPGLVLSTVGVNVISMIMFLYLLDKKLGGLPWGEWSLPFLGLACGSSLTAFVSLATLRGCQRFLGTEGLVIQLVQLGVASFAGLAVFAIFVNQMKLPEVEMFVGRILGRFGK